MVNSRPPIFGMENCFLRFKYSSMAFEVYDSTILEQTNYNYEFQINEIGKLDPT